MEISRLLFGRIGRIALLFDLLMYWPTGRNALSKTSLHREKVLRAVRSACNLACLGDT